SWDAPEGDGVGAGIVDGTLLSLYTFDRFKSERDESAGGLESLEVSGAALYEAALERARVAAESANDARDLQNLPANVATPT
ncbi:hypothetical protein, partial [Salmonella sp. SAL4433]|uniref:hypothetical protein n=1 Tax=Salmonella sp. SAL4433 TaxID=3159888 RepID=UPI0039784ADC